MDQQQPNPQKPLPQGKPLSKPPSSSELLKAHLAKSGLSPATQKKPPQAIVHPVAPVAVPVVPVAGPAVPVLDSGTSPTERLRHKRSLFASPLLWLVVGLLSAVGAWQFMVLATPKQEVKIKALATFTTDELKPLKFTVGSTTTNLTPEESEFSLVQPPKGATIHPLTGEFSWTPGEADGPKTHKLLVRLQALADKSIADQQQVEVNVREVNQPPVMTSIPPQQVTPGETLSFKVQAHDPDAPANTLRYSLGPDRPPGTKIDSAIGLVQWTAPSGAATDEPYQITVIVHDAERGGASHSQIAHITIAEKRPPATAEAAAPVPTPTPPAVASRRPAPTQVPVAPELDVPGGARTAEAPPPLVPGGTSRIAELFVTPNSGTLQRENGSVIRGEEGDTGAAEVPAAVVEGPTRDFFNAATQKGLPAAMGPRLKPFGLKGTPARVNIGKELIRVLEYPSAAEVAEDAARITGDGALIDGRNAPWKSLMAVYKFDRLLVLYAGTNDEVLEFLANYTPKPATASPGGSEKSGN